MSDIQGKACEGSSERAEKRASFIAGNLLSEHMLFAGRRINSADEGRNL
jgi:hypothetical protein